MKTEHLLLGFIIAIKLALVGAVIFFFGEGKLIWADTKHYASLGRSLVTGHGLSFPGDGPNVFSPTTEFMPLYPFILGFFSLYVPYGYAILSMIQAVAAGFSALYVFRIGRFFLSRGLSLLAAVVFAFEPLVSVIHILMMPETFFVLFILIFIYYALQSVSREYTIDWYWAASWLAIAIYTKPAALYLVIPALFLIAGKTQWIRKSIVFVSILIVALSPWMMRNYWLTGTYRVTSNAERGICHWGITGILAVKYRVDASNWNTTVHLPEYADAQAQCGGIVDALRIFTSRYPVEFGKLLMVSTASILTNDGYTVLFEKSAEEQVKIHHNYLTPVVFINTDWRLKIAAAMGEYSRTELRIIAVGKFFWLFTSIGASIGALIVLYRRESRRAAFFLMLVSVYFIGASALAAGLAAGARYRYQIDAILIIFATVGFSVFLQKSMLRVLRVLPITKIKITIARVLYLFIHMILRRDKRIIQRGGIRYDVDLSEGIDLSLFLFGSFQKHVFQNAIFVFTGDEIVFDVGANAGVMSLQFSKRVPRGNVYAFEPTHYAYAKLKKNISLNPELAQRIIPVQTFVSATEEQDPSLVAYASWKVDGTRSPDDHRIHLGTPKDATGVGSITLDAYVNQKHIMRLDFIKIDTDGHEWDVLEGASQTIVAFRPVVVFEVGEYVMKERGITFESYLTYFEGFGYKLYDTKSAAPLTRNTYKKHIPLWGAIDAIAVPKR